MIAPPTPAHAPPPPASAAERVRQASRADTPRDLLQELARDPDIIVRAALALNESGGSDVDRTLAADSDDRVRALLAGRIAKLLPNLEPTATDSVARHIRTILARLAADQAIRVRTAIVEVIKTMDAAPHDLVLQLARDPEMEVSAPLLRLSPVLTDHDLLALLATPPFPSSSEAIASRPTISAAVADAIATYADAPAIRTLLSNRSAFIQEATLDALVGRAPDYPEWHGPLVRRPDLSLTAVRSLSEFIAMDLLQTLAARSDLAPEKIRVVQHRLEQRSRQLDDAAIQQEAQRLQLAGQLTERALLQAIEQGDSRRLAIYLATAACVPVQRLDRAIELRSAKALLSLVWSAGFSMRVGVIVQTVLLQFAPENVLRATPSGGFPLTPEEMDWQIELLTDVAVRT